MKEFQKSFENLTVLLIVAILVIYIVLGVLYESFIHPITILSGSSVGRLRRAVDTEDLRQGDRSVRVCRTHHAVWCGEEERDHDDRLRHCGAAEGKSPREAIWQGCILRFRPIMMTTVAALFGTLPIALAYGEGADARQPLGFAVVGGLVVSQFLTLYITPVIYLYSKSAGYAAWPRPRSEAGDRTRAGTRAGVTHDSIDYAGALRVRNLRKAYKDVVAVDGLDLEVQTGECFGLLGPNGAGKTTTIEICEGLTAPDSGDVEVLGMRWKTGRQAAAAAARHPVAGNAALRKADGA